MVNEVVLTYLAQYGDKFHRGVLEEQLIKQGYPKEIIYEAEMVLGMRKVQNIHRLIRHPVTKWVLFSLLSFVGFILLLILLARLNIEIFGWRLF